MFESSYLTPGLKGGRLQNRNEVGDYLGRDANEQGRLSALVKQGSALQILDMTVDAEAFTVNTKPLENIAVYKNNDDFIALDATISEELQRAGILRDIVRQCQVFRKTAGFEVSDRIMISFSTDSELVSDILSEKEEQVCRDLLAEIKNPENAEFEGEIDLDFAKVNVRLSRK